MTSLKDSLERFYQLAREISEKEEGNLRFKTGSSMVSEISQQYYCEKKVESLYFVVERVEPNLRLDIDLSASGSWLAPTTLSVEYNVTISWKERAVGCVISTAAYNTLIQVNMDLASFVAFTAASILSISTYIITPTLAIATLVKKIRAKANRFFQQVTKIKVNAVMQTIKIMARTLTRLEFGSDNYSRWTLRRESKYWKRQFSGLKQGRLDMS